MIFSRNDKLSRVRGRLAKMTARRPDFAKIYIFS